MLPMTNTTELYELCQSSTQEDDQGALLNSERTSHDDYTLAYRFVNRKTLLNK
jgi:hypothetical protein